MTLRRRLVLAFGVLALAVAAAYGTLTYALNQRQQWRQLESLVLTELARAEEVLEQPRLGATLFSGDRSGWVLQLVSSNGEVVLPRGEQEGLPAVTEPELVRHQGRRLLSAARQLPAGGSVRLGLDVEDELVAARNLAAQLIWLGLASGALAALLGAALASRALTPLARLASSARRVDPADPRPVEYHGPDDEVAEVARALNAALANIRTRRDEERGFLAEIAHELAAPLMLVQGHLEAHSRPGAGEAERSRSLRAAQEAARELLLTSQDLLALARGELERPARMEVVRLQEVIERVKLDYPGVRSSGDSGTVVGDSLRLLQAVRNLVRNAVQATGREEDVTVSLEEREGEVAVSVSDRGPGIAPERLEHIFDRYYSGGGGAGVGLAVVNRVVEQHGARLAVDSGSGGTTFTITLPSFDTQLTAG